MTKYLLCLLWLILFLVSCTPSAQPDISDLQTSAPNQTAPTQSTLTITTAAPTSTQLPATLTPSVIASPSLTPHRPTLTPTRVTFPTMDPAAAATMRAQAQATMAALKYPTAVGTPDPYNLIEAALDKGEIDIDHASIYRLFALFGSSHLPQEYTSSIRIQADGLGAYAFAVKDFDRVSPATQRFLGMFVTPREITIVPTALHPTATPSPVFFPHGLYSVNIEQEAQPGRLPLAGQWKMDLSSADEARVWLDNKLVITRLYRITGNQIEFSDEFGSYACNDAENWASYEWTAKADSLVLTKEMDSCDLRAAVMERHAWGKQ